MSKRLTKDDLDRYHDYGIHLPTRTIYLGSETSTDGVDSGVDSLMADRFIKNLKILESMSDDGITVIMNNPGGDWYNGMAIYDAILGSPNQITVKVYGHAMSMGSLILQAADVRMMSPNSCQMIHYGYLGYDGHSKTAIKWGDQEKVVNRVMENIYLERIRERNPTYSLKKLKEMLNHDTFLTPEDSISLGLADAIIGYHDADE